MGIHITALLMELLGQIQSKKLAIVVVSPRLQKARQQQALVETEHRVTTCGFGYGFENMKG